MCVYKYPELVVLDQECLRTNQNAWVRGGLLIILNFLIANLLKKHLSRVGFVKQSFPSSVNPSDAIPIGWI